MKQFRKIDIPDRITATFQDNTSDVFDALTKNPLLDGQLITVDLPSGTTTVEHKLGREYLGWILVDADGAVNVTPSAKGLSTDLYIYINSSASVENAKFWIF